MRELQELEKKVGSKAWQMILAASGKCHRQTLS
jgi:hypothetical protein